MTIPLAETPAAEDRAGNTWYVFDTVVGACGIAWSGAGLARVQLPEADRRATERRLCANAVAHGTAAKPEWIERLIADLARYMRGAPVDFSAVDVDLHRFSAFHRTLYAAARAVGWGRTTSYGALARQLGDPAAAQAVGRAMGQNPVPIVIPCHRVLGARRSIGGFSAPGGTATKRRLLALEGIKLDDDAPKLPGF